MFLFPWVLLNVANIFFLRVLLYLHCSPETSTTLLISYTPIQNEKFKVWRKKDSSLYLILILFASLPQIWSLTSPWVFLAISVVIASWLGFCLSDRQTDRKTDCKLTLKLKELPVFPWKVVSRSSKQNSLQRPWDQRNCTTKLSLEAISSFPWNLQRPSRQLPTWQEEFLTFLLPILISAQVKFKLTTLSKALIYSSEDSCLIMVITVMTLPATVGLQHLSLD